MYVKTKNFPPTQCAKANEADVSEPNATQKFRVDHEVARATVPWLPSYAAQGIRSICPLRRSENPNTSGD